MTLLHVEQCSKRYPNATALAVNAASFDIQAGESVVLVGESGSGKTTLLRMIAGFEVPTAGRILKRDDVLVDEQHMMPPEQRKMGMLFQDYALFPHLSVLDNVMFGLHHLPKGKRVEVAQATLKQVQLEGYGERYPHMLSGGQQQRVALARALAPQPDLLLLDEPFSNLDNLVKAEVRDAIFGVIRSMGISTISVMHDMEDAMLVADRLLLLQDGNLLQSGSPRELYEQPINPYVAQFMGTTNLLRGCSKTTGFVTSFGHVSYEHGVGEGMDYTLSIRPEHWEVLPGGDDAMSGMVQTIGFVGRCCEVSLIPEDAKAGGDSEQIRLLLDAQSSVQPGETLFFRPKSEGIRFFEGQELG